MYEARSRDAWQIASTTTASLMNVLRIGEGEPVKPSDIDPWKQLDDLAENGEAPPMTVAELIRRTIPKSRRLKRT